jgi:hypothetical protein
MTPGEDVHLPSLRDGAEEDLLIVVTNPTNTWLGLRKEKVRAFLEFRWINLVRTQEREGEWLLEIQMKKFCEDLAAKTTSSDQFVCW